MEKRVRRRQANLKHRKEADAPSEYGNRANRMTGSPLFVGPHVGHKMPESPLHADRMHPVRRGGHTQYQKAVGRRGLAHQRYRLRRCVEGHRAGAPFASLGSRSNQLGQSAGAIGKVTETIMGDKSPGPQSTPPLRLPVPAPQGRSSLSWQTRLKRLAQQTATARGMAVDVAEQLRATVTRFHV
jgi:hypothetical protein